MSVTPKRIGFVDFDLENYHANVYIAAFRKELAERGAVVTGCHALKTEEGRAWAKKNEVPYFGRMKDLDQQVDCYAILAPSNPEVHLHLCKMVFPFGKTTYVDKTFAPDRKTAKKIFALADKCGVSMQTTSALRYTNVQQYVKECGGAEAVRHMVAWGGGGSFEEYAIHPLELVISCMGPKAKRLMRRGALDDAQLLIDFSGGRTAVVNVYVKTNTPFAASVSTAAATKLMTVDSAQIFVEMAAAMLDLFETGTPNIARKESLMIRHILDVAMDEQATQGFVAL